MSKKPYKKEKRETFFQKFINFTLTILVACAISVQMSNAANNNLRIAQISDIHFSNFEENTSYKFLKKSPELLDDVIFQINTSGPYDFVMITGDLVNKPKVNQLEKCLEHLSKLTPKWYVINGNHDIDIDGNLSKKKFFEIVKKSDSSTNSNKNYYAFTPKKGFRVLCLDSIIDYKLTSNGEIYKEEFEWLKKELEEHKNEVIIISTHVPIDEPYTSSNHKMLNEYEIKTVLRGYTNPIIVLQGHYHCARARQDNNIVYITSPSLVTFPNAFRVININSDKNRTLVDVFLKETNLKDIQARSKMRLFGIESLYGTENDRNTTFEIKKDKD